MGNCLPMFIANRSFRQWSRQQQTTSSSNIPYFTLEGQRILAHVSYVYDGDTIHIIFPTYTLQGKKELRKWKCRLEGIDTPELRSHNPEEKEMAYFVKQELHKRICNRLVYIRCGKFDKYGRLLVTIETTRLPKQDWVCLNTIHNQTVNDWLVRMKYAYTYDGGTKRNMSELVNEFHTKRTERQKAIV